MAILLMLFLALPGLAQEACSGLFSMAPQATPMASTNSKYLKTIQSWTHAWEMNLLQKFFGGKYQSPKENDFNIQDFHKSREFRTWFEKQNRMAVENLEKVVPAWADVKYLEDGRSALQAKILAIREAKYTVDMSYYILHADATGLAILGELKQALARGVSVRIMTDAVGSMQNSPQSYLKSLIEFSVKNAGYSIDLQGRPTKVRAKIEIVNFNPLKALPLNFFRSIARKLENRLMNGPDSQASGLGYSINRRSHDKILLIDGAFNERAIAFVGGRNMTNDYYDMANKHIVDAEVMMKGLSPQLQPMGASGIGHQVQEYFDQIYFHLGNSVVTRSLLGRVFGYEKQSKQIDNANANITDRLELNLDSSLRETLIEQGFEGQQIEIANTFHNMFRKNAHLDVEVREHRLAIKNSRSLITALNVELSKEKQEIVIVSPYMWMSKRQLHDIKLWLLKDPTRRLTLVTNSLLTSDVLLTPILVDSIMAPELLLDKGRRSLKDGRLLRRSIADQVKIYEYGKLDSKELGGTIDYGMLHMKAVYLKSSQTAIVGTYNNDPRSLLLNSEGAAITRGPQVAEKLNKHIQEIISKSHEWGSEEYHAIRFHPKMPYQKNLVAHNFNSFYTLILKLKLWWLL